MNIWRLSALFPQNIPTQKLALKSHQECFIFAGFAAAEKTPGVILKQIFVHLQ